MHTKSNKLHSDIFRRKSKYFDELLQENERKRKLIEDGVEFMKTLKELDVHGDNGISITEFEKAYDKVRQKMLVSYSEQCSYIMLCCIKWLLAFIIKSTVALFLFFS